MTLGISVLIVAVVLGGLLSLLKARYDGRFRGSRAIRRDVHRREQNHQNAQNHQNGQNHQTEQEPSVPQEQSVDRLTEADIDGQLGERATLLQFSSAFCAPCRATRRTLTEVAEMVDGVRHVELDAESHLDLVRRLDIMRTPTTLVLDRAGAIVTRASGQPRKPDVIAALATAVDRQTS
ncbi:thioredoxin family protein [Kribbella sp. NBC_01245]|uniref:TlpA family protein disulfide reductase n=1 Tax=Kribbella sp. NBC_01245 TaxID=2903578 RepID=UPI002E2D537B|nr:thioredoxin family protein [Kribbella sp. NBC_01245]